MCMQILILISTFCRRGLITRNVKDAVDLFHQRFGVSCCIILMLIMYLWCSYLSSKFYISVIKFSQIITVTIFYNCVYWGHCRWHLILHWAEHFVPISQIQLHCFTFAPLGKFHHMKWSWLVTVSRMMWVFFIPLWTLAFKGLLYNSTFSYLQLAWCNSQKPSLLPLSLNTIAS